MAKTDWVELHFGMPLNVWLMIDGRAQKHIRDLYERVDVGHAIIAQQAAELARMRSALVPFAQASEDCGVEDDLRIGALNAADSIWESAAALAITFEHLERARSALENNPAGLADAHSKSPDTSSQSERIAVLCPHAPTYDAGLCCGHPDDCTFVSPAALAPLGEE